MGAALCERRRRLPLPFGDGRIIFEDMFEENKEQSHQFGSIHRIHTHYNASRITRTKYYGTAFTSVDIPLIYRLRLVS
jgi:hypothetical protein